MNFHAPAGPWTIKNDFTAPIYYLTYILLDIGREDVRGDAGDACAIP